MDKEQDVSLLYDCFCGALVWDGPVQGILDLQWLEQCGISRNEIPHCLENLQIKDDTNARSRLFGRVQMALSFVRGVVENLYDADPTFRRFPAKDFEGILEACLIPEDPALQVKWIKHLSCWPMARWLRNPLPEPPSGTECLGSIHFPLRGRARRHFKNLLASRTTNKRAARTFWSLCQGAKRGCATVPDEFIHSTMLKHKDSLSQEIPRMADDKAEEVRKKFRDLFHRSVTVERGQSTVYRKFLSRRVDRDRVRNPGYNACFENVRSAHGKAGFIHQQWRKCLDEVVCTGDLLSMTCDKSGVHEVRYEPDLWLPQMPVDWLRQRAVESIDEFNGTCRAHVAAILEPLKCRLITKGNGLPYVAAMPYQSDMWEKLRELPQFALIGEPLEEHHLHSLLDREASAGLKDFDSWVSGDYSAATDGLSQQINSLCINEYLNSINATEEERKIVSAVLGNHHISYPGEFDIPAFDQANGQLMGSPISFPVLCSINLASYWCALEEYTGRKFEAKQLPVLVNGDDILYRANPDFYEVWKRWIKEVGFTLSVGKNYISRDVFTINSECFLHSPRSEDVGRIFSPIGYIHSGLLHSSREERWFAGGVGTRPENMEMPCMAKFQRILDTANDPEFAFKKFLRLWRTELAEQTNQGEYNLFVPCELGGLGLRRPKDCGIRVETTAFQRKLAGFLHKRIKDSKFGSLDENGMHDLTKPFSTEGKTTFVRRAQPGVQIVSQQAKGKVVYRSRMEPLREGEEQVPDLARALFNYQSLCDLGIGCWGQTRLSSELLKEFRQSKTSSMLEPFSFDLEPRVSNLERSDKDFIWEVANQDGSSSKLLPHGKLAGVSVAVREYNSSQRSSVSTENISGWVSPQTYRMEAPFSPQRNSWDAATRERVGKSL